MGYKVVVVGATGNVGREMLNVLAEREFPVDEMVALASRRSLGTEVVFGDKTLKCQGPGARSTSPAGHLPDVGRLGRVQGVVAPKIGAKGCVVIDNSSLWRYDQDVPLIVPEVNADAIAGYTKKNIIANPNCSTAQMVVALKPLHDRATIKRVVVSTYQSVSGAGKEAMDELWDQTKGIYVPGQEVAPKKFPKQIAFNCIPQIDVFMEDGYTKEEWKMVAETKKILDPQIKVTATCVRVPVFVGHSEAINIEFEKPISAGGGARHPARGAGRHGGRQARARRLHHADRMRGRVRDLRQPHPRGCDGRERPVACGASSDNLRKGAALNAVQIAETMINRKLLQERRPDGRKRGSTAGTRESSGTASSCQASTVVRNLTSASAVRPAGCSFAERFDDRAQRSSMNCSRCLPGSAAKDALVDALGERLGRAQHPPPFVRQLDGIGARVFLGAAALQQAFLEHAADDVGERRAVDARAVDEIRLANPSFCATVTSTAN